VTEDNGVETEWNQAQATHDRLDILFGLLHENALAENYDACLKTLYRVLAEASSVLSTDDIQACEEAIEKCKGWESKLGGDVYQDFFDAEKTLRKKMQSHGMLMKQSKKAQYEDVPEMFQKR
jgi:hypothetical protein